MIEDLLKKRTNISFFRKDKVPDKKVIQEILIKANELTPHKNNFWHYELHVYGPEHAEQKKKVALATVCKSQKDYYRQDNLKDEDWQKLEKSYDDWLAYHNGNLSLHYVIKENWHFNEQVTAPYLLAYYPAHEKVKESQKQDGYFKSGRADKIFNNITKVNKAEFNQQSGMHSMVTTCLALEQGLDVSFCKCYFYNENIHSDILKKQGLTFLLGIGYRDENKRHYKSMVPKPDLDEVVKWQ